MTAATTGPEPGAEYGICPECGCPVRIPGVVGDLRATLPPDWPQRFQDIAHQLRTERTTDQ